MVVYKVMNLINGKIYIGKDVKNNPSYFGSGKIIKQAIKKYGKNNFKKEILEFCLSKKELELKEKYWIREYNSTDTTIGYNITDGGSGGVTKIIKVYQYNKNGGFMKEWDSIQIASNKLNIDASSITKVCKDKLHSCGGFIWSYSKNETLELTNKNPISILQYDKDGNFIREWESTKMAEDELKLSSGNIVKVLGLKNRSAFGFVWLRKSGEVKLKIDKYSHNLAQPINQLSIDGGLVKKWDSLEQVAKELGVNKATLFNYCNLPKLFGGFYWEYNNE